MQFGVLLGPCSGLSVPPMRCLCIADPCTYYWQIMEGENVLTTWPTREMDASEIAILHRYYRIHLVGQNSVCVGMSEIIPIKLKLIDNNYIII